MERCQKYDGDAGERKETVERREKRSPAIGGPALTWWLTPTEEQLRARYNPDLLKKSIEQREEREQEFDEFVTKLKEYSKSDNAGGRSLDRGQGRGGAETKGGASGGQGAAAGGRGAERGDEARGRPGVKVTSAGAAPSEGITTAPSGRED
ncbi:CBP4 domain-containing protein [Purpureocillium lilacinum]|uniref:Cytochrome b mRNA-processing protein 4 n=1 Tax=Purpureocillium lilacinum TaxID=33203 RepID=A0A179HY08_PURLI|nr:CBP4 domain-containing protein [Purpureocillium lilacinum]OAQ94250.1 CBP4 domain-containing protein [Purpureocillium lilacinum]